MQNAGGGGVAVELASFLGREVLVDEQRFPLLFLLFGAGGSVLGDPLAVLDFPDGVVEIGGRGQAGVLPELIDLDTLEGGVFLGLLKGGKN